MSYIICSGKCIEHKPKRSIRKYPYELGLVYCLQCRTFLNANSVLNNKFCPCCGSKIRVHPKNKNRRNNQ